MHLYVACWSVCNQGSRFLIGKKCLIAWSFPSKVHHHLIQRSNCSRLSVNFCRLEVALIPWLGLIKGLDHLIQFWSHLQTLQHGTSKWLPLTIHCLLCVQVFSYPRKTWHSYFTKECFSNLSNCARKISNFIHLKLTINKVSRLTSKTPGLSMHVALMI